MSSSRILASISSLFLFVALAAGADLSGRITVKGEALPRAVVTVNLVSKRAPRTVTITRSDARGQYAFHGLRNGEYVLLVDLNGRRVYQGEVALSGASLVKNIELQ